MVPRRVPPFTVLVLLVACRALFLTLRILSFSSVASSFEPSASFVFAIPSSAISNIGVLVIGRRVSVILSFLPGHSLALPNRSYCYVFMVFFVTATVVIVFLRIGFVQNTLAHVYGESDRTWRKVADGVTPTFISCSLPSRLLLIRIWVFN